MVVLRSLCWQERISPDMTVCSTVATSWERASSWEAPFIEGLLSGFRALGWLLGEAALDLLASIELRDLDTVAAGTLASALAKGLVWLSCFHMPELNIEGNL